MQNYNIQDIIKEKIDKEAAMAENNFAEEEMTVDLELEDGSNVTCAVITILTVNEKDYIVLLPFLFLN